MAHSSPTGVVASSSSRRRRWAKIVIVVAAGLVLLLSLFCNWVKVQTGWPSETRNVRQYSQIRSLYDQYLVGHFPSSIPSDATDARLYYRPGFLQQGMAFQVSYRLPPNRMRAIMDESRPKAKVIYPAGGGERHYVNKYVKGDYPVPSYEFGGNEVFNSPSAFSVFFFGGEDHSSNTWNHGYTCGLAINESSNEIVYWAEAW